MKRNLLLCGAVVCAVMASAAPVKLSAPKSAKQQQRTESAHKGPRYAANSVKWLPGTVAYYNWNSWDLNDWELSNQSTFTYNEKGWKTSSSDGWQTTMYEYDDAGRIIRETSSVEGSYSGKTEYAYDAVTGVITCEANYSYEEGKWVLGNKYEVRITRDAKGNITKVENYDTYDGVAELCGYSEIKYGADGKACEITNVNVDGDETEIEMHLTDIVWQNTNGQIIIDDTNDMDAEDYFMGANRIKSATLVNYEEFGDNIYVSADYTDDLGSVKYKLTYKGEAMYSCDLTILDSYGSFTRHEVDVDFEYDENTGSMVKADTYTYDSTEKYDAYGICTELSETETSSDNSYSRKEIADVRYDSTYGYPLEVISKYGNNGAQLENSSRIFYSDYASYDSVVSIESDQNAPVEYYNLNGVRVMNPTAGLYIRRQGSSVTKVLVK